MAIIKKAELNGLSKEDLLKKLNDLKVQLLKENSIKQMQSGTKLMKREIRRTIARIKTILRLKHNLKV